MLKKAVLDPKLYLGYVICILCFAFITLSMYPGLMSPDSTANLFSGREGNYTDIQPPLMALLWGLLDKIVPGPALMFLLQNAVFWGGCAIFYATVQRKSFPLAICLILFALLPQILSQLTTVWKDVGMGVSLFMATALIYRAKKTKSKLALLASVLFLYYGYNARINAFPAVLPLTLWSGYVAFQIFTVEKVKRLPAAVTGFAYFIALSAAVYLTTYSLTGWKTVYPFHQNYLYDLAAISVAKNESYFPPFSLPPDQFSFDKLKSRFSDFGINALVYPDLPNEGDLPILRFSENPETASEEVAELRQKWIETVWANPSIYLRHRWNVFSRLIGLQRSVTIPYWDRELFKTFETSLPAEYRVRENIGFQILMRYFRTFNRPFPQTLFRAAFWMLWCLFFTYQALKRKLRRDWDLVFVLSVSCLLYTLSFFPTTPSTEYRYLFWSAISSTIAAIFGIYLLWTEKAEQAELSSQST